MCHVKCESVIVSCSLQCELLCGSDSPQLNIYECATRHQVVKPATEGRLCRYVELMTAEDGELLQRPFGSAEGCRGDVSGGRAFYFISHGWARPFMELVEMVRRHFTTEQQRIWRPGQPPLPPSSVFLWSVSIQARAGLLYFMTSVLITLIIVTAHKRNKNEFRSLILSFRLCLSITGSIFLPSTNGLG